MQSRWQQIDNWYHGVMGHAFWSALQHNFEERFAAVSGNFAVQVGPPYCGLLTSLQMRYKILIDHSVQPSSNPWQVVADVNALPLQNNSVDVIVLAHALECVDDKIALLKSCWEALSPEGLLITVSFNPYSFYGLRRLLGSACGLPWQLRLSSAQEIKQWLIALDFVECRLNNCGFVWPTNYKQISQRLLWMEKMGQFLYPGFGHYVVISARKRVPENITTATWDRRVAYDSGRADASSRSFVDE